MFKSFTLSLRPLIFGCALLLSASPVLANPQAVSANSDRDSRGANWSAEYEVGVLAESQTVVIRAKVAAHVRDQILKQGYEGLQGQEALQVFISSAAQKAVDNGFLSPKDGRGGVLAIDSDTNAVSPNSCYIIRVCYPIGGGWVECDYYRVCN